MNVKEKASLADFVATVVWPARTVRAVTTPAGEQDFAVVGSWDTAHDTPMAWIDGNRVPFGSITWNSPTSIRLPTLVPFGRLVIILISPGAGAGYMPRNPGAATFLDDVDIGGNRLTHLAPSEEPDDAVRRDEVVAIAQALIGANYALLSGAVFTGAITVPPGAENGHAVRRDQVILRDASQSLTAALTCEAPATTATQLIRKGEADAALAAALVNLTRPNRKQVWSTPGQFPDAWTAPADGILYVEIVGPGGGGGGGYNGGSPEGVTKAGNGGRGGLVRVAFAVTAGQKARIDVGGGGYGAAAHGDTGYGGAGGGGGGRSSRVTVASTIIDAGAGGGGGGTGAELPGGNGGAANVAGQTVAGSGGAVGTAGGDGTSGGVGGRGRGNSGATDAEDGTAGGGSATPSSLIPSAPTVVEWPFGGLESMSETGGGALGGIGSIDSAGTNGAHGRVTFWWYQP